MAHMIIWGSDLAIGAPHVQKKAVLNLVSVLWDQCVGGIQGGLHDVQWCCVGVCPVPSGVPYGTW